MRSHGLVQDLIILFVCVFVFFYTAEHYGAMRFSMQFDHVVLLLCILHTDVFEGTLSVGSLVHA